MPNIQKTCYCCRKPKDPEEFPFASALKDSRQKFCKSCIDKAIEKKMGFINKIEIPKRVCRVCKKALPLTDFHKDGKGSFRLVCARDMNFLRKAQRRMVADTEVVVETKPSQPTFADLKDMPRRGVLKNKPRPPSEEKRTDSPVLPSEQTPKLTGISTSDTQYQETKALVFLIEYFCSQAPMTGPVVKTLYRILEDLNTYSSNTLFKTYLGGLLVKIRDLGGEP